MRLYREMGKSGGGLAQSISKENSLDARIASVLRPRRLMGKNKMIIMLPKICLLALAMPYGQYLAPGIAQPVP